MPARRRRQPEPPTITSGASTSRPRWRTYLAIILVAAYVVLFFATSFNLPNAPNLTRGAIWHFLVIPDELTAHWFGDNGDWAIRDRLSILAGALVIHAAALLLGWPTLRCVCGREARLRLADQALLAHGLGLSLLSLWTFLLGLAGRLDSPALLLAPSVIFATASVARRTFSSRNTSEKTKLESPSGEANRLSPHWLWLILPFAVLVILGGMLPPVEFDVREYHLQAPKEFYQLGRVEFLPHNVYANMPLGAEMWALAAMVLEQDWWRGALVGKTVIASLLPVTALALYCAGAQLGSRTAGIVAALVYVSFPWLLQVSMLGLVDGVVAYYVALVILALANSWPETESPRESITWSILASCYAGAAAACKYPALLFVVAPVVAWIAWRFRAPQRWLSVKHGAAALMASALMFGPWLAKNWYFTGNPVYPLFYAAFDGATRTAERAAQWNAAHRPDGFSPFELIDDAHRVFLTSPWLSPLLWPLVVIAIYLLWRNRRADCENSTALALGRDQWIALLGFAVFHFACWWLFTHRIDRFWLPAVPALALLAGYAAARLQGTFERRVILAFLGLGLIWCLLLAMSPLIGYSRYLAPLAKLRVSAERVDPWILELNRRGGNVLSIGEAAVFDFEHPVLYNTTFDPSWLERYGVNDPGSSTVKTLAAFDKLVADHDLDYIYVDWGEVARYRSTGNYGFDERVTRELFDRLQRSGRLGLAIQMDSAASQIYPVSHPESD